MKLQTMHIYQSMHAYSLTGGLYLDCMQGKTYLTICATIFLISVAQADFRGHTTYATDNVIQASICYHFKTVKSVVQQAFDIL
jgi:hypothetical protein